MVKKYRPSKKYPWYWNKLRFKVFYRDNFKCQLCGRCVSTKFNGDRKIQCHHILPIRLGGRHELSNLVTLCRRCHEFIHEEYIRSKK